MRACACVCLCIVLGVMGPQPDRQLKMNLTSISTHTYTHTAYRALVGENPENYRFHAGLQAAVLALPPTEAAKAVEGAQVSCD